MHVLQAIYLVKQALNDIKCNTVVKCFNRCGFLDNTDKNFAENLFGATVDELHEIYVNNEEKDDDNDDNEIDFH